MGRCAVTRVLSVTSECAPLVKTGGLADVAGALPSALEGHGVHMRTLLPGYPSVISALKGAKTKAKLKAFFGGPAKVVAGKAAGLDLLVLDAPHLFDRDGGLYSNPNGMDWDDNPIRFAALSFVASQIAEGLIADWVPQIVHCHDWQAGLAPYYISKSNTSQAKTILTIHNIAYQGLALYDQLDALMLDHDDFNRDGLEYWGKISALKAGLVYADHLTTVSPTYARELMRPEFGLGLDGVMRSRKASFTGILNGIDEDVWSPTTDTEIKPYKAPRGKTANTKALRKEFGLRASDGPLCIVVSRLTEQKGLDLLLEVMPTLVEQGGQLALLGSGDEWLEAQFRRLAGPDVGVRIGYDEALSHRMMAGGDAILVPSRFEPCGLTQLYGLKYGTIPLVSMTGGLADTVIPVTPATMAKEVATGFQFYPVTADALENAILELCAHFSDREGWVKLQRNAMAQPVGWSTSAARYAETYERLAAGQ